MRREWKADITLSSAPPSWLVSGQSMVLTGGTQDVLTVDTVSSSSPYHVTLTENIYHGSHASMTANTVNTCIRYDDSDNPYDATETIDGSGVTDYTFGGNGNMTSQTDVEGNETDFTYFSDGNPETTTTPRGNV